MKLLLPALFAAIPTLTWANEPLKVTGHIDLHYQFNFNHPRPVTAPTATTLSQPGGNNQYRVFDLYHDNLVPSLAEISFSRKVGPTSALVALGFGHTADVLSPNDTVSKNILEAHITYAPVEAPGLSISAGKMFTHMGLEVARTQGNWNYSRSVLFGYAIPLWHTGLALRYDINEQLKSGFFVYNETVGLYGADPGKTLGAQFSGTPMENATLTYNALVGPETSSDGVNHLRTVHELIPTYVFNDNWEMNMDFVFGELTNARANQSRNASWTAWSIGAKWKKDSFYLSPRYENYTDRSGATIEIATATKPALPQRIETFTFTGSWLLEGGLETRLEARYDLSSSDSFTKGNGDSTNSQASVLTGLLYAF